MHVYFLPARELYLGIPGTLAVCVGCRGKNVRYRTRYEAPSKLLSDWQNFRGRIRWKPLKISESVRGSDGASFHFIERTVCGVERRPK
jgi:hypothetical protein